MPMSRLWAGASRIRSVLTRMLCSESSGPWGALGATGEEEGKGWPRLPLSGGTRGWGCVHTPPPALASSSYSATLSAPFPVPGGTPPEVRSCPAPPALGPERIPGRVRAPDQQRSHSGGGTGVKLGPGQ